MIVQESAQGMTQVKGARKCQRHPPCPWHNDRILIQKRPSTTATVCGVHSSFGRTKYTRYLNCFSGKSVSVTDLGIFSPVGCELHIFGNKIIKINNTPFQFGFCAKLQFC